MKKRSRVLTVLVLLCLTIIGEGIGKAELKDGSAFDTPADNPVRDSGNRSLDKAEIEEGPKVEPLGIREFLRDTGISYLIWWGGRLFYVRNKNDRIFDTSLSDWIDHITDAPEIDDGDSFTTNYVLHSIFGAGYYLYYRTKGHSVWASALGSALMSTLWEYTVEGLVETPSFIDLIVTPGLGVPLGVMMYDLSEWLMKRENRPAKVLAHIVNPMRMAIRDRQIGLLNPLTGAFALYGQFSMTPSRSKAIELAYPFFLESPIPIGRVVGNFEVVNLDKKLVGKFIFYSIRVDFPSSNNRYGIYLKAPYGGINNVNADGEKLDDGFEFSNMLFGGKFMLLDSRHFTTSGGLEVVPPTAFKDNKDRLKTIVSFTRDLPLYLKGAVTLTPYLSAAVRKRGLSLQSNLGIDLIFNADELEGNNFETRIKYGSAIGANVPIPTFPSFFVEFNGYTFLSTRGVEKTDVFLTSGVRFGKKYSPGFGIQIPLAGTASDIAKAGFMVDFQARF